MGGRNGRAARAAAAAPQQVQSMAPAANRQQPALNTLGPNSPYNRSYYPNGSPGGGARSSDIQSMAMQYLYSQQHTYPGYLTANEAYYYATYLYNNYYTSTAPNPNTVANYVAARPNGMISYQEIVQQIAPYYAGAF